MALTITTAEVYNLAGLNDDPDTDPTTLVSEASVNSAITWAKSFVEDVIIETKLDEVEVTETYYGNNQDWLFLNKTPVNSITALTVNGTAVTTSKVDVISDSGKILLKSDSSPEVMYFYKRYNYRTISVEYKYGYTDSTRPKWLEDLVREYAAVKTLIIRCGGTFDMSVSSGIGDFTWSLPAPFTVFNVAVQNHKNIIDDTVRTRVVKRVCCSIPYS